MLEEQNFFRKYGTRFPQQLLSPRITSADFLEFPKNSCFHYTVVDNVTTGPESDLFYLRHLSKKIPVKHITKLANNEGNPRQLTLLLDPVIRKFHARHRRFRLLRDNEPYPTDITNTLIVNHALCSHNYKYIRSPFSDYYRWINISSTIFYQMGNTAKDSSRHQYAIFNLPRQLPSITRLNTFATRQSQEMLKTFSDPGSALILEIWKWLDLETRSKSTLNFLDPSQLSKINIIFEESGKWILINLGLLDSWIQNKKSINVEQSLAVEHYKINNNKDLQSILNVSMESIVDQKFSISSEQLRKIFLRCLMTLMEERTVETSSEEDGEIVDVNKVETEQSDEESNSHAEKLLKTLDDDLSQLEVIEKEQEIAESVQEANSQNSYKVSLGDKTIKVQDFDIKKDHHQIVTELCDKLATDGLMSGAEYRKMLSLNDKAANLQSPVEGVKMSDYIKVSQEDLTIKEAVFPDSVTILDKEQLKSSLNYYDKNYITKTLDKETIGMAFSTQKAGFLITDYKVEENNNILGSQVIHSFKVNPVIGKSSTIYFKVPKINPNGEFIVGGNKYRMRKQRSDLPIRKINHDTVQLSSYYGKVFVSRSNKKTDDYGDWLARSILEKSYEESSVIKDVKPGSVFNNLIKTPVAFSSISREIRQFSCQGYNVLFDLKELQNTYTKDIFIKWYKKGFIIFGDDGKGSYVLIDINNTIYRTDLQKDPEVLSTIEEFLGLDAFKAPVAFIECRVFGSEIPIGLILAYYYGLTNLMQMLKVQPRRVIAGTRVNLQPHEFQIDFSDETLVFNKEDRLATLILAGFNSFHKTLKNYSVYKFDQKGVYLSVLETKKITTRYIRELDLLSDMFVDPITEGLLVMMKEPTTFRGLLVRASELLLDDYYPDPLDIKYQAIRGYERVAGAVYSEMVLAIREQRKSLGRANSQISLNPLAVWKRITTDPAVKITEDINPIMDLKQQEAVTFNGVGGRSSRTINIASRAYHENDKGVISEATSESSDAGINTYLSANPSFDSVRGTTFKRTDDELSATTLLSTSSNLGVAIDTDD